MCVVCHLLSCLAHSRFSACLIPACVAALPVYGEVAWAAD